MADTSLKTALREHQRLEEVLDRDPNFRKWKLWGQMIDEYRQSPPCQPRPGDGSAEKSAVAADVQKATSPLGQEKPAAQAKPVSNAMQIQAVGIQFLRKLGRRAKAREIVEAVQEAKIPIHGKDPIGTVAAHMSNAKGQVDNVRGEGYGLIEWRHEGPRGSEGFGGDCISH